MSRLRPGLLALALALGVGLPGASRATGRADAPAQPASAPRPWKDARPDEREADLARLAREPAGWPRARAASAHLLGAPYQASPLGEGPGREPDPDPRLRFDRMDCLTFVETALALGHATTSAELQVLLDDLRYRDGAAPSFASRLHFFEAQWLPEQLRKGWLTDVTRAQAMAGTLPEGLVLSVVREPSPRAATIVSHTGLVVVKDGRRFLRHARQGRAVIDEPLERFLERHARMKRWKVRGVHLLSVRDNGARASRLLAPSVAAER